MNADATALRTVVEVPEWTKPMHRDQRFVLLGSCFAQYLGDDGDGVAVGVGKDVVDFFPCVGQIAVGEGEKRGDGVVECPGEALVVYFPEQ